MSRPVHIAPGPGEILRAAISVAALGDNTIVTGIASKSIEVLDYVLDASGGANTVTWKRATTGISGAMDLLADSPLSCPWTPHGWLKTGKGESLILNLSAATLVAGHLTYRLTDIGPS